MPHQKLEYAALDSIMGATIVLFSLISFLNTPGLVSRLSQSTTCRQRAEADLGSGVLTINTAAWPENKTEATEILFEPVMADCETDINIILKGQTCIDKNQNTLEL